MSFFARRIRLASVVLDRAIERLLGRLPENRRSLLVYGWVTLAVISAALIAGGVALAAGRSQEIVYATADGDVVSLEPISGRVTQIYDGDLGNFATATTRTGGSRSITFSVLRGEGEDLRGDLYAADLQRGTKTRMTGAEAGEVYTGSDFSLGGEQILAGVYRKGQPPNVVVMPASGAEEVMLEPDLPGVPPIIGGTWASSEVIFAWRLNASGVSLLAYDFFERRQAVLYETEEQIGLPSYREHSNTLVFAELPRGAGPATAEIRIIVGTDEIPLSGTEDFGVYDPSPEVPSLDGKMAALWTDGEIVGLGIIDPETWTFSRTEIELEPGSRYPQISRDGAYLATTDASGSEITIRNMDDGSVVRRVRDAQPLEAALDRVIESGFEVPPGVLWIAPPNYSWRSLENR